MCLQDPLEDMAWRLADGVMQCSFRRNITLPGVKNRFDLNASYYIFVADGAAADGKCIDKKLFKVCLSFFSFPSFFGETMVIALLFDMHL